MKACSLNDFMAELTPWLDKDHIRSAGMDEHGHLVLHFIDGMKNVYHLDDCDKGQVDRVLKDLKKKGVAITS